MAAVEVTCTWCSRQFASASSCPYCGAPTDIRTAVNQAGWSELPPLPDMVTVQFGQSHAQIEGSQVPVVDVTLAEGDGVYFTHDKLLWRDGAMRLGNKKGGGVFKRMRAGMPLVMLEANGPGRVAFSHDKPGEIVAMPLNPNSGIFTREHHMVLATHSVDFDGKPIYAWYQTRNGDDHETHYPLGWYIDHFTTRDQPGLVLLHAEGNVFTKTLAQGEQVEVSPHSVLAYDVSVDLHLHIHATGAGGGWGRFNQQHYLSVLATGPGRIWIQSGTHGKTEEWEYISNTQHAIRT